MEVCNERMEEKEMTDLNTPTIQKAIEIAGLPEGVYEDDSGYNILDHDNIAGNLLNDHAAALLQAHFIVWLTKRNIGVRMEFVSGIAAARRGHEGWQVTTYYDTEAGIVFRATALIEALAKAIAAQTDGK